jgi:cytochrome P450
MTTSVPREVELEGSYRDTADVDPYGFYGHLRELGDVIWDEKSKGWLVCSHAAVREVLRNDNVLVRHSWASIGTDDKVLYRLAGGRRSRLLVGVDLQKRHHRWFIRRFSYAQADRWRDTLLRPIVDGLIDRFSQDGHAELVADFCDRMSVRVITAILGLPWQSDAFVDKCKALLAAEQQYFNLALVGASDDDKRLAVAAADELDALMMPFIEAAKERAPQPDDILSQLWAEGPTIRPGWDHEDMLAWVTTTYFAGTETTSYAMKNALYVLLTTPNLQDEIRRRTDDGPLVRYTDEVLRLYPSPHFVHRLANVDFVLAGASISAGDTLFVLTAAANRDQERYPCPGEVNLEREKWKEHLAFSVGPRMCAGSAVARAEIQEAVAGIVRRLPDLRLDPQAEAPHLEGFLLRSFAPLHVLFTPAPSSPTATL